MLSAPAGNGRSTPYRRRCHSQTSRARREEGFRLKASNGQVIAVGEAYETKASAVKGIESVRKNAGEATVDDLI